MNDSIATRVQKTISCRDCDYIPKVEDAGRAFSKADPPYQKMHNGVKVLLGGYHGDWMQNIIESLKGHHEPQEEKVFYEILKCVRENPVMLELGSFWAYYSLWFLNSHPAGKSFLVEPVKSKLELGKKNFELNGKKGQFMRGCVGSEYIDQTVFVDWNGDEIEMTQYSVDSIMQKNQIDFIDILHSDIQGAEFEMLQGASKALEQNAIGFVVVSTHGDQHQRCLDFILDRGMHIIASHSIEESVSADGLIVAQSNAVPLIESVTITK